MRDYFDQTSTYIQITNKKTEDLLLTKDKEIIMPSEIQIEDIG